MKRDLKHSRAIHPKYKRRWQDDRLQVRTELHQIRKEVSDMTKDAVLLERAKLSAGVSGEHTFSKACKLFANDRGISLSKAGEYISEKHPEFYQRHFAG